MAIRVKNKRTGQLGEAADRNFDTSQWEEVAQEKPKKGFVEKFNLLPALGGALGFLGGGPILAAGGAGAGEALEQFLFRKPRGEAFSPLGIAGEAAFAGIGGPLISKGLGLAGRAIAPAVRQLGGGLALKSVAPELASSISKVGLSALPDEQVAGSLLGKLGAGLRQGVRAPAVKGPTGALKEVALSKSLSQMGLKGAAQTQRIGAGNLFNQLNDELVSTLKRATIKEPITGSALKVAIRSAINANTVVDTAGQRRIIASVLKAIPTSGELSASQIGAVNLALKDGGKLAGATSFPGQAMNIAWRTVNDLLKKAVPETEGILGQMSVIHQTSPSLQKEAAKNISLFGVPIMSQAPIQAAKDLAGRGIEALGAPGAGAPATAGAYGLIRALMSGQEQTQEVPQPGAEVPQTSALSQVAPQLQQQLITPDMVVQAYLYDPEIGKQLEQAFNAQSLGGGKELSDRSASLSVGQSAIQETLSGNEPKGYGPATGRYYQFALQTLGGAGVPEEAVSLNSKYQLLKQNIVRSFQGARMSDTDIALASQYVPSLLDTQQTATQKLIVLNDLIAELRNKLDSGLEIGGQEPAQSNQYQELFQSLGLPL